MENTINDIDPDEDSEINFKISLSYLNSSFQKKINFINELEDPFIFFRFNFDCVEIKNSPFEHSELKDSNLHKLHNCDFNKYECNQEGYVIKFNVKRFIFLLNDIDEDENLILYMLKNKHKNLIMVKENKIIDRDITCKLRLE